MAARKRILISISLALILCQIDQIYAKSAYVLSLNHISCTVNPDFVDPPNCYINETSTPSQGLIDMQMHREVKTQIYEITIDLIVNKKKRQVLHLKKSSCDFFTGRVTAVFKIIRNLVLYYGKLPEKCPVEKDFRYLFPIVVDSSRLPSILFEGDFYLKTINTENNVHIFTIAVSGNLRRNSEISLIDVKTKV